MTSLSRRSAGIAAIAVLAVALFLAATIAALPPAAALAAEPTVVRELIEERTAYATTYELANGQRRVIFSQTPVHFQDEQGDWQKIDPSLVETDTQGVYATTAAPVEVQIAAQADGRAPLQLTTGEYQVSLDLLNANESDLTVDEASASFPGVATATDLRYEPTGDGLKETLVLRSTDAPNSFTFRLTHTGLELRHDEVDGWGLYEPDGKEPVLLIGELLVWDSSRDESDVPAYCNEAEMKVEPGQGASTFTYEIPSGWLADEERLYPVFVDPNLFTRNPTDVYISDGYPNTCYGTSQDLFVGKVSTATSLCKTLVKFPQIDNIPAGSHISSATFSVRQYWQASSDKAVKCYRVTNDSTLWGEAATWNNVTISGTDKLDDETPASATDWLDWSCVDYVQGWLDEDFANKGFLITAGSWDSSYAHKLRSGEYSDADYRPKLSVDYEQPTAAATPELDVAGYTRIGDIVTVEVAAADVAELDQITELRMGINRVDDQGADEPIADRRGVFGWFADDQSAPWETEEIFDDQEQSKGFVAYYDSNDFGRDHIVPLLEECDYDPETGTATFVFQVDLDWGEQDDNDFDTYIKCVAEENSWNSGWLDDETNSVDILPTSPQHTVHAFDEWNGHATAVELEGGSLTAETTDLAIATFGPAAELSRHYSSSRTTAGRFAPGWRFAFDRSLDISANEITYTDEAGEEHLFTKVDSDWIAPTSFFAELAADDTDWMLTFTDMSVLRFDSSGTLVAESDAHGNATTYAWASGDLTITAANGQTIVVTCNGSDQVVSATYQTAAGTRTVNYATSSPWEVTYFPSQDEERTISYTYSSSLLTEITQHDWPQTGEDVAEQFSYDSGKLSAVYFADYDAATKTDARATISYDAEDPEATVMRFGTVHGVAVQQSSPITYTWDGDLGLPTTEAFEPAEQGEEDLENQTSFEYGEDLMTVEEDCNDGAKDLSNIKCAYDDEGNLTEEIEDLGSSDELTTTFDYQETDAGVSFPTCIADPETVDISEKTRIENEYDETTGELEVSEEYLVWDEGTPANNVVARTEYGYQDVEDVGVGDETFKNALTQEKAKICADPVSWAQTDYSNFATNGEPQTIVHQGVVLAPGGSADPLTETATYDAFGNLTAKTDTSGETVETNTYDLAGRLETSTDASGVITHYTYDVLGNEIESWRTVSSSDAKVDWVKRITIDGEDELPGYDACGRVVAEQSMITTMDLDVPLEMLDGTVWATTSQRDVAASTMLLDPSDYDGASYYFEIVALNTDDEAHSVSLRDATNDAALSSISVPASTYSHTRIRAAEDFEPAPGTNELRLRLPAMPVGEDLKVFTARIVVEQRDATRTRLQFPLLAGAWQMAGWTSDETAECYIGYTNATSYSIDPRWARLFERNDETLSQIAGGKPWTLETLVAHDGAGESSTCLYNVSDSEAIAASEGSATGDSYQLISTSFAGDAEDFDDEDLYEVRLASDGTDYANIARAALYVELSCLEKAAVNWRIGDATYAGTGAEQIRTERAAIDLDSYSGTPSASFEASGYCADAAERLFLYHHTTNDSGTSGWTSVEGLQFESGSRGVLRTAFNLTDDYRYLCGWESSSNDHQSAAAFVVLEIAGETAVAKEITHTYDGLGKEITSSDSTIGGQDEKWIYDAAGNVISHWEIGVAAYDENRATRTTYDELGQVVTEKVPGQSGATTHEYDMAGNITVQTNPDGSQVLNSYDDEGNLTEKKETLEGYDSVTNDDAVATTTYEYNDGDQLIEETKPSGLEITYTYDLAGNQTGVGSSTLSYNTMGWLLCEEDGDGIATEKSYDAAGRLDEELAIHDTNESRLTDYAYNDLGQVTDQVEEDAGTETVISTLHYVYDAFGRTIEEKHTVDSDIVKETHYSVDSLGRTTDSQEVVASGVSSSIDCPENSASGTVTTIGYDESAVPDTQLVITTNARQQESTREALIGDLGPITRTVTARNAAERWTTATLTGSLSFSRTFDATDGQLTGQSGDGFSSAGTYTYDPDSGRKSEETLPLSYGGTIDTDYEYDATGRLESSDLGGLTATTFSAAGNLTAFTDDGGTASLTYNSDSQLTEMSYSGTTTEFDHDATNGWRTEQGPTADPDEETFDYLPTGRLIAYDNVDTGVSADYAYDAAGQRIESVIDDGAVETTIDYTYSGLTLLSLEASTDAPDSWRIDYLYDEEDRLYAGTYRSPASSTSPTLFVIITTDRGDVVELLDEDGDAFAAYRYDEWGNPTSSTTTTTDVITSSQLVADIAERQVLRYAGYAYDEESSLYYCSARHYDPYTRQFLSKDPVNADGEESAYQYCGGEPVGNWDPSGLRRRRLRGTRVHRSRCVSRCPGRYNRARKQPKWYVTLHGYNWWRPMVHGSVYYHDLLEFYLTKPNAPYGCGSQGFVAGNPMPNGNGHRVEVKITNLMLGKVVYRHRFTPRRTYIAGGAWVGQCRPRIFTTARYTKVSWKLVAQFGGRRAIRGTKGHCSHTW